MEPAVKSAAQRTCSGRVGVLATSATFQSEPYARLLARYAQGVEVIAQSCPGWVEWVEAGRLDDPSTAALVERYAEPLRTAGVDELVLGCTHYPFLRPWIERSAGPGVEVIDPAPAVARQAQREWMERVLTTVPVGASAAYRFVTTGEKERSVGWEGEVEADCASRSIRPLAPIDPQG